MQLYEDTKTVILTGDDLQNGFVCPVCKKWFKPNGTGPSNNKVLTAFIQSLPFELVTGGLPARFHDSAYLLCPEGYAVFFGAFHASNRQEADKAYLKIMLDEHKDARLLAKAILYALSYVNFSAVRLGGKSSFAHAHG